MVYDSLLVVLEKGNVYITLPSSPNWPPGNTMTIEIVRTSSDVKEPNTSGITSGIRDQDHYSLSMMAIVI